MTITNLQNLANQMEQSAKSIEAKVKGTNKRFDMTGEMMSKKIPALQTFGKAVVFQARWQDNALRIEVPQVCKSYETQEIVTQLPNLDYLAVDYVSYVTGIGGYAVVEIEGDQFQIGLISNSEYDEVFKGEGVPPSDVLDFEKRPEIPLRDKAIPLNVPMVVIANGKYSKEHNTPMCDIKIESTGEVIKNVLCNTQLERLIMEYGKTGKCRFKVTEKVDGQNGRWYCKIFDLNGEDFGDLDF